MTDLSVIILSYNTKDLTKNCLTSLFESLSQTRLKSQVIVLDNASSDGSSEMLFSVGEALHDPSIELKIILNKQNVGYASGNNQALSQVQGQYTLFLNSDVVVSNVDFSKLLEYFNEHKKVGALTVRVNLPTGRIDQASHRGFPTPYNSLTYFLGLEKFFGSVPLVNKYVGGYHMTYKDLKTSHEIDSPSGAFFLGRTDLLKKLGGFDDVNFFMYGEDLDLAYRIKEEGYTIMYYPRYSIIHHKYASGLKGKGDKVKSQTKSHFYNAMKSFYKKHYERKYPSALNSLIYWAINLKQKFS